MSEKKDSAVAGDASESQETRQSIDDPRHHHSQRLELDALAQIIAVQAQAINDMIVSLNNLQQRVASIEQRDQFDTNGVKKRLISLS